MRTCLKNDFTYVRSVPFSPGLAFYFIIRSTAYKNGTYHRGGGGLRHFSNMLVKLPSGTRCIMLYLNLHLRPYFVCAISEGSGETAHKCSLA